jgi:D-lactate dehydrogenase (quinone)
LSAPGRATLSEFAAILGPGDLLTDPADCWTYGYDNSRRQHPPDAVAFPRDHEQVRAIMAVCNRDGVPVVPRGRGTGTAGASVPVHGGVALSLERMDRILQFAPDDRMIVVEPGVTNQAVQDAAGAAGLFWPPDPTSAAFSTIGGNLACNAAGPRGVKYGTTRDNVLGLRAVTGGGLELRTGVRTSKGVVGYDLTRLLVGSEGTLAIITEATLKLSPLPAAKRTMQAVYTTVHAAAEAVSRIMAQPATPCALEFIDGSAIEMIRAYSQAELPRGAGALLMIEVDGMAEAVDAEAAAVRAAASLPGLIAFRTGETADEVAAMWATRKALSPALRKIAPKKINEDIVVPVSSIPALIAGLDGLAGEFGVTIVNFGHAGNGNIHVNLLVDPDDPRQMAQAEPCLSRVFDLVLSLGGTLSGEHGVGYEKRDFVDREIEPAAMGLMRGIKALFDPNGLLNPGKMFPDGQARPT